MRIVLDTNAFVSAVFFAVSPDGSSRRGATVGSVGEAFASCVYAASR